MIAVDRQKVQCDLKAKNIIISVLPSNELFRISKCKSAKEIWETLQSTHEEELKSSLKQSLESEKKKDHESTANITDLETSKKSCFKTNQGMFLRQQLMEDGDKVGENNLSLMAKDDKAVTDHIVRIKLAQQKILKNNTTMWYLDSGCSKHMTSDKPLLSNLTLQGTGYVIYVDNNQGKIKG